MPDRTLAPGEALLTASGLKAGYSGITVLHGIDISVSAGEVVALLGANGAGKSTTLRALSGVVKPSGGTVHFDGEVVTGSRPERMLARGVAHVPEGREVFGRLTVEENLVLGTYLRRGKAAANAAIESVYERFGELSSRRRQAAGTLSGGEQQMLAIGRALVAEPRLIMLDEPSLGLSPRLVTQVFALIGQLKAEGMTILLVEQNTKHALGVADRAYVFSTGRVALAGTSAQLRENEDLVHSAYLGGAVRAAENGPLDMNR